MSIFSRENPLLHKFELLLRSPPRGRRKENVIHDLKRQLAQRDAFIAAQSAALAHTRKIFDRSSEAARIGVWECSLPDETLSWTDVVYDLFDLPRGSTLTREDTVRCYSPDSARELKLRRDKAIEQRSGFSMDAEIVTAAGNRKWLRLTATVESENGVAVRIFGMKQDITEEKLMVERMRYMADFDLMTGIANRSHFQTRFPDFCDANLALPTVAALLLVDLDGFKAINDSLGHAAGDACLKETADRLSAIVGERGFVARIGGDEFAVLLGPCPDRGTVAEMAHRIVGTLSQPMIYGQRLLTFGASVGIAVVDASTPAELYHRADLALYAAKAAGRGTFRFGKAEPDAGDINDAA